jgi:putative oxidoreductase
MCIPLLGKTCSMKCSQLSILVLRLALGTVFTYHGFQKLFVMGIPAVTGFMESLGLPLPGLMAILVTYGELLGGILLIFGFLTYFVATIDIIIALVAFFTVHLAKGFGIGGGGYEYIMLIFATSVYFFFNGPGYYSIDSYRMHSGMKMGDGMMKDDGVKGDKMM